MATMKDVIYKAAKKEDPNLIVNEAVYDRYEDYFKKILKIFPLEKKVVNRLKKSGVFDFKDETAEELADLLYLFGMSKTSRDRNHSTKRMERQILQDEQYNAVLPQDILTIFHEMIQANKLVICIFECIAKLLKDAKFTEDEINMLFSNANRKYSYHKRKSFQDIFETMEWYIQKLMEVNEARGQMLMPTENENAVWLDFANKRIRGVMEYTIKIWEEMREIICDDVSEQEWAGFRRENDENVISTQMSEEKIIKECFEDDQIKKLCDEYKSIMEKKFDLESFVLHLIADKNNNNGVIEGFLQRIFANVPLNGDVVITKNETERITEILDKMNEAIQKKIQKYSFPMYDEQTNCDYRRIRDEDLLEEAIRSDLSPRLRNLRTDVR